MAYTKIYTRIDWKNENESKTTPLGATNLNKMDNAINELDNRAIEIDLIKFDKTEANSLIKDWTVDVNTGIITITKVDGSNIVFDLNIEKVPVDFELTPDGVLKMTTDDGQVFTANIAAMIPVITFKESDTIGYSVVDGAQGKEYTFSVKDSSISSNKLVPNYLSDLTVLSDEARLSAQESQRYSQESKTSSEASKKSSDSSEIAKINAEQSSARAEQLVMQAYDILNNSGGGSEMVELRDYSMGEFKPQDNTSNFDTSGIAFLNGRFYATTDVISSINVYSSGSWSEMELGDKVFPFPQYLCPPRELSDVDIDRVGIYYLGKEDFANAKILYHDDNVTLCNLIYIEPDISSPANGVKFMDMIPSNYAFLLLGENGSIFVGKREFPDIINKFIQLDKGNTVTCINKGHQGPYNGFSACGKNGNTGVALMIDVTMDGNCTSQVYEVCQSPLRKIVWGKDCYLTFSDEGDVYRSDNGSQWIKVSSLKDFDAQSFLVKDAVYTGKEFIVLTEDLKIFSSEDKGGYWRKVSDANPDFKCIYSSGDGNLLIGSVKESIKMITGTSNNLSLANAVREIYYEIEEIKKKI